MAKSNKEKKEDRARLEHIVEQTVAEQRRLRMEGYMLALKDADKYADIYQHSADVPEQMESAARRRWPDHWGKSGA